MSGRTMLGNVISNKHFLNKMLKVKFGLCMEMVGCKRCTKFEPS